LGRPAHRARRDPAPRRQSTGLGTASSTIKEGVSRATDEATRQGAAALDSLKGGAQALGSQAKDRAGEYVEGGISAVTQSLEDFATAIRAASDELSQKDQTMAAQIVRQAAGGLESLSRSVSGTSIDDIISSVRRFGRNNPAAFMGGAVLAGLALGRFARASGRNDRDDWRQDDWRQGGSGQESYSGQGGYSGEGGYSGQGGYSGEGGYSGQGGYGSQGGSSGQGGYQDRQGSQYGGRENWSDRAGGSEGITPRPYSGTSSTESDFGSSSTGSGVGGAPSQSQGYAGGGMGAGSTSTSGPSSETDESVTSSSTSTGGLGSSSISTGGNS
jgi:hypothetical protein